MSGFHIKDVCRILGVKAHVIRYWEQEINAITPRKDIYGTRMYNFKEINILFRIKYLARVKGYSLGQIRDQLWEDLRPEVQDSRTIIQELRSDLILLLEKSRKSLNN